MKRKLLFGIAFAFLACIPVFGTPPPEKRALPRPSWLNTEPVVIVGNWDSMAIFRRRVGGNPVWQEEDYRREHTEEAVKKLKELGVTMAVIHFYKGYGLEAEREQLEDSKKLAALCKKYGLRVGVYVGSTIAYETFLAEKPEVEEWFAPPYLGKPLYYWDQTFRKRVYFMHPGYREYMKGVLRIAIEDLKADLIHFDNTSLQAQPEIFLHPLAIRDFREYLKRKHSPEMLKRRFGFADVRFMEPPQLDRPLSAINDPLFQEWADFRTHQLTAYYAEMEAYIRGLNPEIAVESNPHVGISGHNTVWEEGVDYPSLLAHMDVVWTEEGNEAGISQDGVLLSKIRTYKMASILGNKIFTYTGGEDGGRLQMAEAMAYNRGCLGMVGGVLAGYELPADHKVYVDFFHRNFDYYRDVTSGANVAVLHSYASMAFNNDLPWQSSMLFQQALIQAKVPFDIIFDQNLNDLSKYRVLVLPDQESLSDEQMSAIRAFVQRGGGLVATEHSSLYTEWRQRRRNFGLAELFKVDAPKWAGAREQDPVPDIAPVRNEAGAGRVIYIPSVKPAVPKPPSVPMISKYWKLPLNWQELVSAVRWAARDAVPLDIKAPLTVTAELLEQKDKGRLLVHILNFDAERTPEAGRVDVSLTVPDGKIVQSVALLSPDEAKPVSLPVRTAGGRVSFTVPRLKTYTVAAVQLR